MGKTKKQPLNDIDIVNLNEIQSNDNDIVEEDDTYMWKRVREDITEWKLDIIQRFMFGSPNRFFGDCREFTNPAIKQVERFTYVWLDELSEEARKLIINNYLANSRDKRSREYKEYLSSPVWKYISSVIKLIRGYTCEMCKKQYNPAHLVVHHHVYDHLGSEIYHLDDVAVLCTDCHLAVHNIRREDESKQ